jgi:hypothetical protein
MAPQAQSMGSIKDIQSARYHGQRIHAGAPASVQAMVGSVYLMLMKGGEEKQSFVDLPQNATNFSGEDSVSC